jgi:hypothetical protein
MERSNFFTDQDVLQEDLNNLETTKIQQLKYRSQYILGRSGNIYHQSDSTASASVIRGGIYWNVASFGGELSIDSSFLVQYISPTSLRVLTGAALSPGGEFMLNPSNITMNKGSSGSNYNWMTTVAVPAPWYVKLYYNEASGSIKADDLGVSYPTRYTDDFIVAVNLTPPSADEILLASFVGSSIGDITTGSLKDERSYVRIITSANAVLLDPSTVPVAAFNTVQDHVEAVGSGTPTQTNPHGLTGNDIGLTDTTGPHRKEAHIPGIIDITGEYPDTAPFKNSYLGVPYDMGAVAGIAWTAPHASASIMVKGAIYHPTLDTVVFTTHPDIVAGGYPNTYYFYYEGSGSAVRATIDAIPPYENNYRTGDKFILCRAYVFEGGSSYSNFLDLRKFYSISQVNIRAEGGPETAAWLSLDELSTLWDNLCRIRYQLGKALNGSDWAGDNPLTSGVGSNATAYHEHRSIQAGQFIINEGLGLANPHLGIRRNTGQLDGLMYHVSAGRAYILKGYTGGSVPTNSQVADLVVGSLYVQSNQLTTGHVAAMPTLTGGPTSNADAYHTHSTARYPSTGSVVAYTNNRARRNEANSPMYLSTWVFDGAAGGDDFILYISPTSGSLASNATQRVYVEATGLYNSMFGVVPPYWFYKIFYAGTVGTLKVYEYPANGIDAEGSTAIPD